MITSDIETLEVFYAHTISPVCIAVLVSACVFCFVGAVSSWAIALVAMLAISPSVSLSLSSHRAA